MSLLGSAALSLTGGLRLLAVPALLIGVVTAGHQMVKARADATAAREQVAMHRGREQCLSEVQLAQARADLVEERRKSELARAEATAAANTAREVGDKVNDLEEQLRTAQSAAPGSNPGCLSDGMRQRLWGTAGGPAGGTSQPGGGQR